MAAAAIPCQCDARRKSTRAVWQGHAPAKFPLGLLQLVSLQRKVQAAAFAELHDQDVLHAARQIVRAGILKEVRSHSFSIHYSVNAYTCLAHQGKSTWQFYVFALPPKLQSVC